MVAAGPHLYCGRGRRSRNGALCRFALGIAGCSDAMKGYVMWNEGEYRRLLIRRAEGMRTYANEHRNRIAANRGNGSKDEHDRQVGQAFACEKVLSHAAMRSPEALVDHVRTLQGETPAGPQGVFDQDAFLSGWAMGLREILAEASKAAPSEQP